MQNFWRSGLLPFCKFILVGSAFFFANVTTRWAIYANDRSPWYAIFFFFAYKKNDWVSIKTRLIIGMILIGIDQLKENKWQYKALQTRNADKKRKTQNHNSWDKRNNVYTVQNKYYGKEGSNHVCRYWFNIVQTCLMKQSNPIRFYETAESSEPKCVISNSQKKLY